MRVGGGATTSATTAKAPQARAAEVAPTKTAVDRTQIRDAIGRAYEKLNGRAPSKATLATLTAHACHETASGASMYNYNFGGIKGRSPEGLTANCRTKEVVDGKEISITDGFRAYRTLDDGAVDYLALMQARFGNAMAKADKGDMNGFAHALKQSHYYTANENTYAAALRAHAGEIDKSLGLHAHAPTKVLDYAATEARSIAASAFAALDPSFAGAAAGAPLTVEGLDAVLASLGNTEASPATLAKPIDLDDDA